MEHLFAASASPTVPTTTLVLALVLGLLGYALACALFPYTTCSRCGGSGKHHSPTGTAWRTCSGCGGRGARLRLGRRLFGGNDH